jgi:hypothetical protein
MLEAIRRAISLLRQKQILHKLGVAISVTVIAIACYVLFHMLRHIDVDDVIEAIKETEYSSIAWAGLFVAAPLAAATFRTGSMRWPPSPAIRSATMSAPASSPVARCAIGYIPPGV